MASVKHLGASATFVLSVSWYLLLFLRSATADCAPVQCPFISPPSAFSPSIPYQYSSPFTATVLAEIESAIATFIGDAAVQEYAVSLVHADQVPFTSGLATTPFLVGSITKTFTALGALILREKGLLSLDDPVKKFLPNFSIINPYPPHEVTLRELMGHVSGMPRELCPYPFTSGQSEVQCPVEECDVLASIAKMQLIRPPWSREPAYSNLGFGLLGHAWEKATLPPQSWQKFVMEEIVKPLGMIDTGLDLSKVTLAPNGVTDPTEYDIGWVGPAGIMYSTAIDLAKYLIFLLNASPPLISDATIREWTRSSTIYPNGQGAFALPWELRHVNSTSEFVITKVGIIGPFTSFIGFHPATQLGVAVLFATNASSISALSADALGLSLLNGLIPVIEAANEKIIDPHYTGRYVCQATPAIFSQPLNTTVQVLGGEFNITGSTSIGLSASVNLSLAGDVTVSGSAAGSFAGSFAMLLKNATENSFWLGGNDCFLFLLDTISGQPSYDAPNRPGTAYEGEIAFDLARQTLEWPAGGAVCVRQ